jgi:glycosyltransferase involved in cell wall biosynthesis
MRISAVIIVFNLEEYIGQAIDSVLNQSRKPDEIIVVDDCSTDASAERVNAYGQDVRYLRMPRNSGALLTALEGVKAATGDVVCMLDGDDYWAANKVEVVEREFLDDAELLLLSHDHVRVNADGADLKIVDETHQNISAIWRQAQSRAQLSSLLRETVLDQKGYWLGSAYSFRRALFDIDKFERQIALFGADKLRKTYLDLTIAPFLVLTNPGKNVGYTPDTRFYYRIHDKASLSGNLTPEKARESALKGRTINELIDRILQENGATPRQLSRRRLILEEFDFLCALYRSDMKTAARLYAKLAGRLWNKRQLVNETKPFAAVAHLGPERFLQLKTKASR